jgi:transposase InsO family protein
MAEHRIQGAKRRGKPWRTTKADPGVHRPPDLVERDFTAERPNALWVADFTYLRCWEGVLYFAFVLDAFSRMVVGWQLAANMRRTVVLDALRMALGCARRAPTSRSCTTQTPAASLSSTGRRNRVCSAERIGCW